MRPRTFVRLVAMPCAAAAVVLSRAAYAQEQVDPPPPAPPPVADPPAPPQAADPPAPVADPPPPPSPPPSAKEPEEVVVPGTVLSRTAGSAHVLRKDQLERYEYDDPGAVLQQVPGVYVRGEDGIGLRPNIGIRGANPDRSKKLTLMEDGILFGPAPYSAPAAYYFPLVTRMTQVRVVKGPSAIAFGPHTVGGAIDFLSRPVPTRMVGAADLALGQYGYNKVHAYFGAGDERMGFLVEGVRLQNTGFMELPSGFDTGSTRSDWMVKGGMTLDSGATKHHLLLKLSYGDEKSNETYLGKTDADVRFDAYYRYPASALDQMNNHRTGVVLTHVMDGPSSAYRLKTSVYRFDYQRVWNKLNRLGGASPSTVLANADDPTYRSYYAVLVGDVDTGSPADRLYVGPNDRTFVSQGVQTVLSTTATTGVVEHQFDAGLRLHYDSIKRLHTESAFLMQNRELVPAGEAVLTTADNKARTYAAAVHLTDAMRWKRLTVMPGARVELIESRSEDFLKNTVQSGLVPAVMPGIGVHYGLTDEVGLLAGVYRGFSPPAPGTVGAKPEYSVNYEAGARYMSGRARAEVIGFFNAYSNLTDVCSLASGCVTVDLDRQFDAGRARIVGVEAFLAHEPRIGAWRFPMSVAYTATAGEFLNDFTSADPIYGVVKRGDSMPYIPLHQLNVAGAVEHRRGGFNAALTYVSPMREQAGRQPIDLAVATDEQVYLDLGAYFGIIRHIKLYANLRNALGGEFIIGRRPYGARVNPPRWLQVGVKVEL